MSDIISAIEPANDKDVDYIKINGTTYKVTSFYIGEISFLDLIKNALKREADSLLRQSDKD